MGTGLPNRMKFYVEPDMATVGAERQFVHPTFGKS